MEVKNIIQFGQKCHLSDVTLVVKRVNGVGICEKEYAAHKVMLARNSSLFNKILSNPLNNENIAKGIISVGTTTSFTSFEKFCNVLYSDRIFSKKDVPDFVGVNSLDEELEIVELLCEYICDLKLEERIDLIMKYDSIKNIESNADGNALVFLAELLVIVENYNKELVASIKRTIKVNLFYSSFIKQIFDVFTVLPMSFIEFILEELRCDHELMSELIMGLYDRIFTNPKDANYEDFFEIIPATDLSIINLCCIQRYTNLRPTLELNSSALQNYRLRLLTAIFRRESNSHHGRHDCVKHDCIKNELITKDSILWKFYENKESRFGFGMKIKIKVPNNTIPGITKVVNVECSINGAHASLKQQLILRSNGSALIGSFSIPFAFDTYNIGSGRNYNMVLYFSRGCGTSSSGDEDGFRISIQHGRINNFYVDFQLLEEKSIGNKRKAKEGELGSEIENKKVKNEENSESEKKTIDYESAGENIDSSEWY